MSANKIPESLFSHCLKLVAGNLDLVENFLGFPSLIGEKIFIAAEDSTRWSDHTYVTAALKLFTEAFEGEILSSVNLSGQHLGLNFYLSDLLMFRHIVKLDVSGCGLGDEHELLAHVTHLERLEELSLRDDCLSDTGIQKMTAPYRMFQKGPTHLQTLDISGNMDVTVRALKYLAPFPRLQTVLLPSGPHIPKDRVDGWQLTAGVGDTFPKVWMVGWAGNLVLSWMDVARKKAHQIRKKKRSFYSNSRKEQALGQSRPDVDVTNLLTMVATRPVAVKHQGIRHEPIQKSKFTMADQASYDSILRDVSCHSNRSCGENSESRKAEISTSGKPELLPFPDTEAAMQTDDELLDMYSADSAALNDESAPLHIGMLEKCQPVTNEQCRKTTTTVLKKQRSYEHKGHATIMPGSRKRKWTSNDSENSQEKHKSFNVHPSIAGRLSMHRKEMAPFSVSSKVGKKENTGRALTTTGMFKGSQFGDATGMKLLTTETDSLKRAKLPPAKKIKLLKSVKTPTSETDASTGISLSDSTSFGSTSVPSKSRFLDALDFY